ncbi:hypothetical protein GQ44DRAFT_6915 [Phaeosphaeriaceae sp. PMI808]|nr:hypothetical protein GQ44DRAFT_6915 [Phaeosphaeriaceae sp. PMI808]
MAAHQFRDLPQIPQSMDGPRHTVWGADHYNYMPAYKEHIVNFPRDDDIYFGEFDNGAVSMQPMERFMHDLYPHPPGVLGVNIPTERQPGKYYEDQWPSAECHRNISPDRTSASGTSTYATQNEFHSPHTYHAVSYGSLTSLNSQSFMPCLSNGHFKEDGIASNPLNISLYDLEYEHADPETEPAMEDIDSLDLKQEAACDLELIATKIDTAASDGLREYADSGIGNSVRDAESVQPIDLQDIPEDPASDSDYSPKSSRSGNRRRSSASNGSPVRALKRSISNVSKSASSNKVSKRRRASNATKKYTETDKDRRPFLCPLAAYSCTSTFTSKNEWKRHVSTQHIKLGFWRCDLCPPTIDQNDDQTFYYNDFNRKDLFTQHLRRMHAASKEHRSRSQTEFPVNENNLSMHQARCFQSLRTPPQSSNCLFCDKIFVGQSSWEERMEHVGRHLEKDRKGNVDMLDISLWNKDSKLEGYLLEQGLIVMDQGNLKIGNGKPTRLDGEESNEESEED